jgi:LysM repeat protein
MRWKLFIVGVLLGSLAFHTLITNAEPRDAMPVAFMTQFDGSAFAGTDCGPAAVAMAINYATGEHLKPLEVRQAIAKLSGAGYAANPSSGTAIGDLARIARAHDVEVFAGDGPSSTGWGPERIRKHLAEGHTVIALTRLALLPGYSPTSQFDHYILLIGTSGSGYVYNDPGMSAGAKRTISEQQLQTAQRTSSVPGQGVALAGPKGSTPAGSSTDALSTFTVTVARGDTLSQIAERFGLAQKDIVALNRATVPNVDRIQIGQVLTLPAPPRPAATVTPTRAPNGTAPKPSTPRLRVKTE